MRNKSKDRFNNKIHELERRQRTAYKDLQEVITILYHIGWQFRFLEDVIKKDSLSDAHKAILSEINKILKEIENIKLPDVEKLKATLKDKVIEAGGHWAD